MFRRHISRHIAGYIDGRLPGPAAQRTERHLRECARCRAEYEQVKQGIAMMEYLPPVQAPGAIWLSIETALKRKPERARFPWRWAFAAALVLMLVAGSAYWSRTRASGPQWEVRFDGAHEVTGKIGAGDWIETDAASRAIVKIGDIGSVDVAPNSRVRVLKARRDENRLALARGKIHATILAPPKLFFVDTASGTAVDLGCEYELSAGDDGSGVLRVTRGWVSFDYNGLESQVPAGASCQLRPKSGPGIPYFDDAPGPLKQAVQTPGNHSLSIILAQSRVRDTLTLWHLLSRVEAGDRARVFDRIAALTPIPAGVSREKALKLDPETLTHWKEELAWTW